MIRLLTIICVIITLCGCHIQQNKTQQAPSAHTPEPLATVEVEKEEAGSPTKTAEPERTKVPEMPPQPTPYLSPSPNITQETLKTVIISISGIDEHTDILPQTKTEFEEGQTVFDVLFNVAKENQIQIEFRGSKKNAYIRGIDNLYEFDKGGQSGWVYSVNGIFPRKSCGTYTLNADDVVEIKYTTKIGEFQF